MNIIDVILAAYLHDVGKPMQRGELEKIPDNVGYCPQAQNRPSHLHVEWTNSFFQQYCPEFETASKLAASHHKTIAYAPEEERWAAEIIRIADCVASGHDRDEVGVRKDYKSNLLHPIFSKVNLTKKSETPKNVIPLIGMKEFIYQMINNNDFYATIETSKKVADYKKLTKNFITDFKKVYERFKKNNNKKLFLNSLDQILNEYFWCVPANTQEERPVGSLYNHSKIVAMISCVLYQSFASTDKEELFTMKTDDSEPRFLLIGGELNGIQNYIYDINPEHAQKAAKILRARSFKVKMYSEMILHYIINELDILKQNIIMNAGGKFILIVPNTDTIKEKLTTLKMNIESEMFVKTQGFLNINLNWNSTMSLMDFKTDLSEDNAYRSSKFQDIISGVFADFDLSKRQKFSSILKTDKSWNSDKFRIEEELTSSKICNICKRKNVGDLDVCDFCYNEIELGKQLQHKKFGIIGKNLKKPIIDMFDNKVCFSMDSDLATNPCAIESNDYFALSDSTELLPLNANAVSLPRWEDHYSYVMKKESVDSDFLSFSDLSKLALEVESDYSLKGVPYLGVLKGDVDSLGLIFNKGIENNYNVTVWSTLSSQIDLFFSRFIPELIKSNYHEIYTLYTGGDDFVLIGPWNKLLRLTKEIQTKFTLFCANKDIHFSAGFSLFHGKDPVKYAINESEQLLEISKKSGKNRITVFDTTVTWDEYYKQLELSKVYDRWLEDKVFSMQSIYKLYDFNKMALKYNETREAKNLMYISRLHYDFNRNVYSRRNIDQLYKDQVGEHEGELSQRGSCIMNNLKIALHLTVYKNRKGGRDV